MTVTLTLNEISPKSKRYALARYVTKFYSLVWIRCLCFSYRPEPSILRSSFFFALTFKGNKIFPKSIVISLTWFVAISQSFIWFRIGYKLCQILSGNQCWRPPARHLQTNSRCNTAKYRCGIIANEEVIHQMPSNEQLNFHRSRRGLLW